MIQFSPTGPVTAWQFPDDQVAGEEAFLGLLHNPAETWIRAYAFTMKALTDECIAAHQAGVKLHIALDRSQEVGTYEKPEVERLVAAGVETTIATSYAGSKFIAHEKGLFTAAGECWEGSTNFSSSAWQQINTALQFDSSPYVEMQVASFNREIQYAWANEKQFQLMSSESAVSLFTAG